MPITVKRNPFRARTSTGMKVLDTLVNMTVIEGNGGSNNVTVIDLGQADEVTIDAVMRKHPIPVPYSDCFIIITAEGTAVQTAGSVTMKSIIIPVVGGKLTSLNDTNKTNGQYAEFHMQYTGRLAPDSLTSDLNYAYSTSHLYHTLTGGEFRWATSGTTYYIGVGNKVFVTLVNVKGLSDDGGDELLEYHALLTYINENTGSEYTDLGEAIRALVDEYNDSSEEMFRCDSAVSGEQVSYGSYYPKDYKSVDGAKNDFGKAGWKYCESIDFNDCINAGQYYGGWNLPNLKRIIAPKITTCPTNYFVRQQYSGKLELEEVTIGSIGYPVTSISASSWLYFNTQWYKPLVITIYVNYQSIADIPTTITNYAFGDGANRTYASVVYRSSVTGEILQ